MHRSATLLTLFLAASGLAQVVSAQVDSGAPAASAEVGLDPSGTFVVDDLVAVLVAEAPATLDEALDLPLSVAVEVSPASEPRSTQPAAPPPSPQRNEASPAAILADAAAPAAGLTLLAFLLGALAFGIDGLRMAQLRAAGFLSRGLRVVAGAALFAVPLFSRIDRGQAMENPVRARVHEAIAAEPGLSLSEVSQRAGIAWGTTVHHLRRLETLGLVVSVSQSPHRRYFVANTPAAAQRTNMAVVMQPTARRIAEFVAQRPGTDQAGICHALGLNNPAASKHLSRFEASGLVLSQRSGRNRHYHATGGLHSALLLLEPGNASAGNPAFGPPTSFQSVAV